MSRAKIFAFVVMAFSAAIILTLTGSAQAGLFSGGGNYMAIAKRDLYGNPTGWGSRWCGKWMSDVLVKSGRRRGYNRAIDYRRYGRRSGARVGAIAVQAHHVGFITQVRGNTLQIIAGNAGGRSVCRGGRRRCVSYQTISRSSVRAYRMP